MLSIKTHKEFPRQKKTPQTLEENSLRIKYLHITGCLFYRVHARQLFLRIRRLHAPTDLRVHFYSAVFFFFKLTLFHGTVLTGRVPVRQISRDNHIVDTIK